MQWKGKQNLLFIVLFSIIIGIVLNDYRITFLTKIDQAFGATEVLYDYCYEYGFIITLFTPIAILKSLFDYFMVTANNPKFGLYKYINWWISTNMILRLCVYCCIQFRDFRCSFSNRDRNVIPSMIGINLFFKPKKLSPFSQSLN